MGTFKFLHTNLCKMCSFRFESKGISVKLSFCFEVVGFTLLQGNNWPYLRKKPMRSQFCCHFNQLFHYLLENS